MAAIRALKEPELLLDLWLLETLRIAEDAVRGHALGAEARLRWPRDYRFAVLHHAFDLLEGREEDAVSAYREILKDEWSELRLHLLVIETLQRSGHPRAALPFLEEAHRAWPGDDCVWFAEGVTWERLEDPARAEQAFR